MNNPKPSGIIQAFKDAVANLNVAPEATQLSFDFGERYEVTPGDSVFPLVFLEFPMKMEAETPTTDAWYFDFLILEQLEVDGPKGPYVELYGRLYNQAFDLVNELRDLFNGLNQGRLMLQEILTQYDDFEDNCSGYRVELKLITATDRFQC